MPEVAEWEKALEVWLEPFLEALGHKVRCRWAPIYLRGLLGRSERKSVQPMAAELTPNDYDQLHNFIASPVHCQPGLGYGTPGNGPGGQS